MGKITLGEVAIESKATWKSDKVGVPIVGLEHLEPGEITLSNWEIDSENTFTKKFLKGQVLLGRRRVYLRKAVIAPVDGICSGDITVIEAIPGKILPELLPFVIQNDKFFDYAVQGSAGSLSPRVKWEHLKKYSFELPSIDEQKVLTNKLWTAYRLKESYKKLLSATDEMVKSQFIEMFGGIQNDLKWPLKPLGKLCEMVNGYAFKSTLYSDSGYSIIRIANVQKGNIDDSDKVYYSEQYKDEFNDSILKEGDILISLTGNVGRAGVVYNKHLPAALNQRVQGLRIKDASELNHQYLFSLLNLDSFEELCIQNASGSAQLNLSTVWLRNCKIVCPPIDEQVKFALIAQQADKSKFELRKSIEAIDAVIKSLING